MPTEIGPLFADLRSEQVELSGLVAGADLSVPTPAAGWDIRDTLSHLAGTDVEALLALTRPAAFLAKLPVVGADIEGFLAGQLAVRRGLAAAELLGQWQDGFEALLTGLARADPAARVPWYGPPMNVASFATARLMEYWAHGQDVADALDAVRVPTSRLRHLCHLGYRTRDFAYLNRGLPAPPTAVRLDLTAPDGTTWSFGDAGAPDRVRGPAVDFCLLVTQRRYRGQLALAAAGPHAEEWLAIAQCFAGPPGPGRRPA